MNEIKQIFDEIASDNSTNNKIAILSKYKDNELLKRVLYLANSKRIKFFIKRIPEYQTTTSGVFIPLEDALDKLDGLIKRTLTGNDAINHLKEILTNLSPDDAYIVERIIEKDCKIGMGKTNINKVFDKLIEKTPYMGAKAYDSKLVSKMFVKRAVDEHLVVRSDIKMDGRYNNGIVRNNEVEAESRQGERVVLLGAKFMEELTKFPDCVLNGELTIDGIPRYESNGIITSLIDIQSKRELRSEEETNKKIAEFEADHMSFELALDSIRYTVWDVITVDEYYDNKSKRPLKERFRDLIIMLETVRPTMISLIEHRFVSSVEEAHNHFQEALARGLEGTILKAQDGEWKDGKPNWQIKFKLEMNLDLKIVGFNKGTGKNAHVFSSVKVTTSDGLLVTQPTGITEKMMQYITDNHESLMGTILEVKCSGISQDSDGSYSLLHPVFIGLRDDKTEANSLKEVLEIESSIKGIK